MHFYSQNLLSAFPYGEHYPQLGQLKEFQFRCYYHYLNQRYKKY